MNTSAAISKSFKGELEFSKGTYNKEGPFKKEAKTKLAYETRWYVDDFFGERVLFAGIQIKNPTTKAVAVAYYVAFFNRTGDLVASANQSTQPSVEVQPGERLDFGSCIVRLPPEKLNEISRYEVIIYEREQ
jgi:hypothetical protein